MKRTAEYLIVQHVSDLFRREPRNVGVVARMDGVTDARFFGEIDRQLDRRKIRALPYPDVYSQWVRYWRRRMERTQETAWEDVRRTARDHYQILDGGMMDGVGEDTMDDVLNYLYTALVSEGGIASAIGGPDEADDPVELVDAITEELKSLRLLTEDLAILNPAPVRHPVRQSVPVAGKLITYRPAFVQENGHVVVMEPVKLTFRNPNQKPRIREKAAFASVMFNDIREEKPDSEAVAIINVTVEEEKQEQARDALKIIHTSAAKVVNWQSATERRAFLEERQALAAVA